MNKLSTIVILLAAMTSAARAQTSTGASGFWDRLGKHCGKAYEGVITEGADNAAFKDKRLVMQVRSCENNTIRIPFLVGDDRSRTWVLSYENEKIQLKHDHRHEDGTEDKISQYGGWASNSGLPGIQVFPADVLTAALIPQAATNVWWITIDETHFTYNLRRIGSERLFTVRFDLTKPLSEKIPAPWGSKD